MKKGFKIILIFVLIVCLSFSGLFIYKNLFIKKSPINISKLSPEFMDNYFEGMTKLNETDNKSNILIVTSLKKIKDTYGATEVVEGPNHQYFLQYRNEDDMNKALEQFNDNKDVSVTNNYTLELFEDNVFVASYNSWGVELMGIDSLLDSMSEMELNDVVVAIIDTGLDVDLFNESYSGRLAGSYNVLDGSSDVTDNVGHGTHIAGTIAETTPDSVKILPIKVSNERTMFISDCILGINYVTYGHKAELINMSYGGENNDDNQYFAIEAALEENIISLAATGNSNTSKEFYPAAYDNTISIAAIDSNKSRATFSNYGNYVMFAAPGVDILSINGTYSGTSMATPHAVGAAAILRSLNPNLSKADIIKIFRRYSEDLGDISWDEYYGYGFINFSDASVCDGIDCDEYDVFKRSEHDDLEEVFDSFEIIPVLSDYNYGSINNILGTRIIINYKNGKSAEYTLYDIKNINISNYDPYSTEEQTIDISFTTALGFSIEGDFKVTNPSSYESVWEYNILDNNTIEISGFKDTTTGITKIIIPETIDGYTVVATADGNGVSTFNESYDYLENVISVYLPSTLTKIGNYTFKFSYTTKLNYVKSEAESLYVGNYGLSNASLITVDANISYLGDYAFYWDASLTNFRFSDDITHIGNYAFSYAFTEGTMNVVTIPATITEMGNHLFDNSFVNKVVFLNTFEALPEATFMNSDVEEVVLPEGIVEIGIDSFMNAKKLRSINFPTSLTTLRYNSFDSAFQPIDLVIPETITNIGYHSLSGSGIKSVVINSQLSSIDEYMFNGCKNLETVVLPNTVESIERSAFGGCPKLKNINLENITSIADGAFSGSFDPTLEMTLVLPNSVQSLGQYAFSQTGLKKIVLNDNILAIPNYLFDSSSYLEEVVISDDVTSIGESAFYKCPKLVSLNMPSHLTSIGHYAFSYAYDPEAQLTFTVPNTVTNFGDAVFAYSGLKKVIIDTNISSLPWQTFYSARYLEEVVLPDSITSIGNSAFYLCDKLKGIDLSHITSIGDSAFANAFDPNEGVEITLPSGLVNLGATTFINSNIKKVELLSSNIETLSARTFSGNLYLEKVILPEGIKTIENEAFYNNYRMSEINLPRSIESIHNYAFFIHSIPYPNIVDLTFYVYANSYGKTYAASKISSLEDYKISYIQIDPDEVVVNNVGTEYHAGDSISLENVTLDLTYYEEEERHETIDSGIGVSYQTADNHLAYGDTAITIYANNAIGYRVEKEIEVSVSKAIPTYVVPTNLTAHLGQSLSEIVLPSGFEWIDSSTIIDTPGQVTYKARFIPEDTDNYEIVDDIDITITVYDGKTIITPIVIVSDKTYDGTTNIPLSLIAITGIDPEDFNIVSASTSSTDVGEVNATIRLRLTDEKFIGYSFDNALQEKDFIVSINILPLSVIKPTVVEKRYTYNGSEQTFELNGFDSDKMNINGNVQTNAGDWDVSVSLKNNNYIWSDDSNSEIVFRFTIEKAEINITDNTENSFVYYDGHPHQLQLSLDSNSYHIKFMNQNEEYILDECPSYIDVGVYTIKYMVYIDDNYTKYYGEKTLTIARARYIITFYANNGTDNYTTQEVEDSISTTLDSNTFTNDGFTFAGWNTEADGSGESYSDEQAVSFSENTTLYAQWEEDYDYIIKNYSVDEDNKYISRIPEKTLVDSFTPNFTLNTGYGLDIDTYQDTNYVYTGGETRITHGLELYQTYTNIVMGDNNGDGIIDSADLLMIRRHLLSATTLTGPYFIASDNNHDEILDSADLLIMRRHLLGSVLIS